MSLRFDIRTYCRDGTDAHMVHEKTCIQQSKRFNKIRQHNCTNETQRCRRKYAAKKYSVSLETLHCNKTNEKIYQKRDCTLSLT